MEYIDDLLIFKEIIARNSLPLDGRQTLSGRWMQRALDRYVDLDLSPHPSKTFIGSEESEIWGTLLEDNRGFVRASLKRVIPSLFATIGILKIGVTTVSLLDIL